ncbi:hypothetical protein [Streptomyces sp. NBC_01431]|uniref:hypothetical protein n=1 Tax=Streptomyces sp. NBC_01431 TaxID=2903863 RepID=UPI002E36734C|nr:hypothetical protein [Streptomyces sp. NBC_01431]
MSLRKSASVFPPDGSSLALLKLPFSFTQDRLLDTDDFMKAAKDRGYSIDLALLQEFHRRRLLLPLYRVSDTPAEGRRVAVVEAGENFNVRGWVFSGALEGKVRDPEGEGYSASWPYERPPDQQPGEWWNGFAYSSWQLLDIADALREYEFIRRGFTHDSRLERMSRKRARARSLVALSPRYLPGILGTVNMPPGGSGDELWRFRSESDVSELLQLAGFTSADLLKEAESLLGVARIRDPLKEWLPLLRHASYKGWSQIQGVAHDCMWYRVAAEVFLRAHEELAAAGKLTPLPDISGFQSRTALHDRLTPRHDEAESLERALGSFGLSPHPRVLLLVEGETELYHLPRLLAEFGLGQSQHVRVQRAKGSKISPMLIARYSVSPRIGRRVKGFWLLDATPTALVVAMDAENKWETPEQRANERRKLQEAIREEVQWQGADITQEDLDFLVRVHVWGSDKYELANFSDDELVPQIRIIAEQKQDSPLTESWEHEIRAHLQEAREKHRDIKVPLGKMRLGDPKVQLAELLWPVLLAKCEQELADGTVLTPVLRVVQEVCDVVARLSSGGYALKVPEGYEPAEVRGAAE